MKSLLAVFFGLIALLVVLIAIQMGVFSTPTILNVAMAQDNRAMDGVLRQWAAENEADLRITYLTDEELDALIARGPDPEVDVVWPASSLQLSLADPDGTVRHAAPILRSPIVLGLRTSIAEDLGWAGQKDVPLADIREAALDGRFRLSMAAAPHSTVGAATYFGLLYALSGTAEALSLEDLQDESLLTEMKALIGTVDRTARDATFLADSLVANYAIPEAIFTSEAHLIAANQKLTAAGEEPLLAVYPQGLPLLTDSPIGLLPREDEEAAEIEELFFSLLEFLHKPVARAALTAAGHRPGRMDLDPSEVDRAIWNPEWGIDPTSPLPLVPLPTPDVVAEALRLYQEELRKPSLTVWVVDLSDSMSDAALDVLKSGLTTVIDPMQADAFFLQPTSGDVTILLPFNHTVLDPITVAGADQTAANRALRFVDEWRAEGGTDVYFALYEAYEAMRPFVENGTLFEHVPAIVVMADGLSVEDGREALLAHRADTAFARFIPVHTVAFRDADTAQLKEISDLTQGEALIAGDDLAEALRRAKANN